MDKELVDYFIKHTNDRLALMDNKLDRLLAFKWQVVGGSVILSIIVTVVIQIFIKQA